MSRADEKNLITLIDTPLTVFHATNGTGATLVVGPIDVFQIQIDTPTANAISFTVADGDPASNTIKNAYINAIGTREFTFLGRPQRVVNCLFLDRPQGDVDLVSVTVLYRPVV